MKTDYEIIEEKAYFGCSMVLHFITYMRKIHFISPKCEESLTGTAILKLYLTFT